LAAVDNGSHKLASHDLSQVKKWNLVEDVEACVKLMQLRETVLVQKVYHLIFLVVSFIYCLTLASKRLGGIDEIWEIALPSVDVPSL
jgi:hypothetical protein